MRLKRYSWPALLIVCIAVVGLATCQSPREKAGPAEEPASPGTGVGPDDPGPAAPAAGEAGEVDVESAFAKSLHHTGEGMRYWYEREDGLMAITEIPYKDLDCKNCHAKNCRKCHGDSAPPKAEPARKLDVCLTCHTRAKCTIAVDKAKGSEDVHFRAGMVCMDCHTASEVHGDGREHQSMRKPGVIEARCMTCHEKGGKGPAFDGELRSHKKHADDLTCNACHVENTMSCYNCHFDEFLKTGRRSGNFIKSKESLLLVNYNGKVTSGIGMSITAKGKRFVAYAPYFTHSVMKKGRSCESCHKNEAVLLMKEGKSVPILAFENGEIKPWKGVIPLVKGKIAWTFFDKAEGKWVPLEGEGEVLEQYTAFAEPLTERQLKKLGMPAKSK